MTSAERAVFVAAYSRLVAEVWSDPAREEMLTRDPRALLATHGLTLPDDVEVRVVRDVGDAEPVLDVQVRAWRDAGESGSFVLFVPAIQPVDVADLAESELDNVVAGIDASCACCCPCCCT
jgi:hypothetical protein